MAKSKGRFLAELLGSDGKVEKAKSDAGIYAGANVTIAADGTLTTTTLPLAGGALTGAVTTNSTFDGVDIATRDAILTSTTTTAGAALPKAGGTMTGALDMGSNNITTTGKVLFANVYSGTGDLPSASTYHGMFAHVHGTGKGYFAHAGSWVELANQSGLTTATTTANAALPKAGGTMTGTLSGTTASFSGVIYLGATATANDQFAVNNGTDIFIGTSAKGLRTYKDLYTNSGNNKYWHAGDFANSSANWNTAYTVANAALPKAGGTMTGNIAIDKEDPNINLSDTSSSRTLAMFVDNNNSVVRASGPLLLQVGSQSAITIDASRNATFAGTVTVAQNILSASSAPLVLTGDGGANIELYGNGTAFIDATTTTFRGTNGSGQGNISAGTIDSGAITSTGTGTAGSPTLDIINSSSSTFNHSIEAMTPNLTSGESNILVFGRESSTKNAGYIGYKYSSAGSNDNVITLGHWGSDHLVTINGVGNTTFTGTISSGRYYKYWKSTG